MGSELLCQTDPTSKDRSRSLVSSILFKRQQKLCAAGIRRKRLILYTRDRSGSTRIPRYCILESDQPAVRIANGSGDTQKLRGVLIDDSDKALARLQSLEVKVFDYSEVEASATMDEIESFGDMSRTSLQSKINQDFVDYQKFDLTEKKLAAITKAIKGPSVLNERQKSYEARMRSVAKAQKRVFERNSTNLSPLPLVQAKIQQPWAAIERFYVKRSEIERLLPKGILPSFTIPIQNLSGSMNLIEMESRVLPQRGTSTDSLDRTESAAMSETRSLDDTSLSSQFD